MRNEVDYLLSKNVRGNILNIASNAACMDIIGGLTERLNWRLSNGRERLENVMGIMV